MDLVMSNELQTQRLSDIRDALLPRLLSGELDVSDAARFVGATP
jgi:hypothetical protein